MTCTVSQAARASQDPPVCEFSQSSPAGWIESLRTSHAAYVWKELHRVVRNHPRARLAVTLKGQEGGAGAAIFSFDDLTQELYVRLLEKGRFEHYLASTMSNAEIEAEISRIELPNLLNAELRKLRPESYRLARRISTLLRSSPRFRPSIGNKEAGLRRHSLADSVYGLKEWMSEKRSCQFEEIEERVSKVQIRRRDTRLVGRTVDAQLIISNAELEVLMAEVFEAADAPLSVRHLRQLIISRLPALDEAPPSSIVVGYDVVSSRATSVSRAPVQIASTNPEQMLLSSERADLVDKHAEGLFDEL